MRSPLTIIAIAMARFRMARSAIAAGSAEQRTAAAVAQAACRAERRVVLGQQAGHAEQVQRLQDADAQTTAPAISDSHRQRIACSRVLTTADDDVLGNSFHITML